ncbi:alkaline phosphatase [bacterium]|nr:alkaline phosphatase [bacterium]
MKNFKIYFYLNVIKPIWMIVGLTFLFNCSQAVFNSPQITEYYPQNIILFIGDGMGVSQVTALKTVEGVIALEKFKQLGLITTWADTNYITDSAAAGTALATGYKTRNRAISVSLSNEPLKTVLEYAEERGKWTGLITTKSITDATPASFAAHVDNRNNQIEIAEQLVQSGVEVAIGGGLSYFLSASQEGGRRTDEVDLIAEIEKTHIFIRNPEELSDLPDTQGVFGLLAMNNLPKATERSLSLGEMTEKALRILSNNQNGFFLMVEGAQIDPAGHENNYEYLIGELIEFDKAVGVGLAFAESDRNTLVIVTADHETGGFAIAGGSVKKRMIDKPLFASGDHTATMVPLFAYGPQSELFEGIHDNTFVGKAMIELINR